MAMDRRTLLRRSGPFLPAVLLLLASGSSPMAADPVADAASSGGAAEPLAGLHYVPDLLSPSATFATGPAPSPPGQGQRIVVTFSVDDMTQRNGVLLVKNGTDEVMHAFVDTDGKLYVSDGLAGGTPRQPLPVGPVFSGVYALEVNLAHDGYTAEYTLASGPVTARTDSNATVGQSADPSGLAPLVADVRRVLHYPAGTHYESFRFNVLGDPGGWSLHDPLGQATVETTVFGDHGAGRIRIAAGGGLDGTVHLHAPLTGFGTSYVLEASFQPSVVGPLSPAGVPDHQVVAAGASGPLGEPTVHWALALSQVGPRDDRWSVFFLHEDGTRTQVGPTWTTALWHQARVFVDEANGTVSVQVDEAPDARTFVLPLTPSAWVAVGDPWRGDPLWTGGGEGIYDHLAAYPI